LPQEVQGGTSKGDNKLMIIFITYYRLLTLYFSKSIIKA